MYNPISPGDGLSGSHPAAYLRLSGIAAGRPGWPGFFDWLANFNPELHNVAMVTAPSLVRRQAFQNIAPTLQMPGGINGLRGLGWLPRHLRGLGQDGSIPTDYGTTDVAVDAPVDLSVPTYTPDLTTVDIPPADVPAVMAASTTSSPGFVDTVASMIKAAGGVILPLVQDQQLLSVNLDRAKKGLPPLNLAQYQSATKGVNVGLNPSTQSFLLTGGLVLGGLWLASRIFSRR
jgi:hypothetical protein